MQTLIKNGTVIDTEPEPVVLGRVDVRIEGGRVAEVGPELDAPPGAEVIDAAGRLVLPGFVDTHRHTWQAAIRAAVPDVGFDGYLGRVLGELAPRYRHEDVYVGNLAGALECLDAGITTLLDWSHIQLTPGHTDAALQALRDSGVRAVFGYCHGGEPGAFAAETRRVRAAIPEGGLLTMAMAAFGPEIAPEEHADEELRLARELGLPVTAHLGVSGAESAARGLAFLEARGWLNEDVTYIHATSYDDEDLKRIAGSGGAVSVSPLDEMTLGMGYPVTGRARAAGIPTAFGIDTVTCAPGDMFSVMRTAYVLERGRPGGGAITTRDVLRMATSEGARVAGLAGVAGSLRPGAQADVVLLSTATLGMAAAQDPIGAVVLNADTSCVETVLVAGRVVKRDGRLLHHDVPAVLGALAESAAALV
ncbi:amidohydrolase family protein [Nonomuraea pusilla]|uniref:Cytosine/adenosine deaminase n=1 Tax=Nonomuraea pusilla TaxID=46177 RepID=A0A1H7VD75_9ACTN|nr:amidohydrolase family protein [Nonomuraea pusilla]SEM06808.1 Cytosine/adenosine deaminase [Nonomuraea pusilla]